MKSQLIALLIVLSFLLSCQRELTPEPKFQEVFRFADIQNDPNLSNLVDGIVQNISLARSSSTSFSTEMGELQLDQIIERISHENQPGPNYSIALIPPDNTQTTEWLVLVAKSDGYIAYILQLEPDGVQSFSQFSGAARILDLERNIQAENYIDKGITIPRSTSARLASTYVNCDCRYVFEPIYGELTGSDISSGFNQGMDVSIECICDEGGGTNGGDDNTGIGTPIPTGETSTGDDSNGGGTNGGDSGDSEGVITGGGIGEIIGVDDRLPKCGEGETWDGEMCVSEADLWENDKITLSEAFKNDPCLMEIWNASTLSNEAFQMLAGFLGKNPIAELRIGSVYSTVEFNQALPNKWGSSGAYGVTVNYFQEQYIYLNFTNMPNASSMFIVSVLAHELIHANIYEDLYRNTTLLEDNNYSPEELENNFPLIFDLWINNPTGGIEAASHEVMAQRYRTQMINFMREMDIILNGSAVNESQYENLSWMFLKGTPTYNENVSNGVINETSILETKTNELNKGKCN